MMVISTLCTEKKNKSIKIQKRIRQVIVEFVLYYGSRILHFKSVFEEINSGRNGLPQKECQNIKTGKTTWKLWTVIILSLSMQIFEKNKKDME